jgi:hypothetical protein
MSLLSRRVSAVRSLLVAAAGVLVRSFGGSGAPVRVVMSLAGATAAFVCLLVVGAAPAAADSCPNAAFRQGPSANLPDCRAYELVTPPLGNGWFPFTTSMLDASHLVFSSLGAPGSPVADPFGSGASYVAARTASGWVSTPIDPPASEYRYAEVIGTPLVEQDGVSQDFSEALSGAVPLNAKPVDARLVLRRADGSFVEIGPTVPPATVAAWQPNPNGGDYPSIANVLASPDLSHVFFTSQNQQGQGLTDWLWPGDTTTTAFNTQSLYEYTGTGNSAPTLVAVDDSGQLISQCGAGLGDAHIGGSGTNSQAISSDGSKAFFTAWGHEVGGCDGSLRAPPVDELFARVNGTQTVAISEPTPADCSACQTANPAEADFQGASLDGSRVLFLTTQGLLPGDTDTTTDLYMYDFNAPTGQKIIQVSAGGNGDATPGTGAGVQGVVSISQDGSHVYFVATGILTTDPNGQGQIAQAGQDNLYVYERDAAFPNGRTAFVATLSPNDSGDWSQSGGPETTPDGRFLLLPSSNNLTLDASGAGSQLYRYDAQTGQLVRVTVGEDGFNQNGNTGDSFYDPAPPGSPGPGHAVAISDDGSYVFFESPAALTPQALNDHPIDQFGDQALNVYEWHAGQVYLLSDGRDTSLVFGGSGTSLIGASPTGSDVYITSGDQLVPQDGNSQGDIYDVRIGGGFPAGQGAPACSGDSCQGALTVPPPSLVPGSSGFSGPGNAKPGNAPAKPKVLTRTAHGATFLVAVTVPSGGRITITGAGIRTARRLVARAGTYKLRMTLTPKAKRVLARKHTLKLRLRVVDMAASGTASSITVAITVKPAVNHRRGTNAGRAANTTRRAGK